MVNISKFKRVFLVGIGGVSMSAIAESLYRKGYDVSGSDKNKTRITERLESLGIKVFYEHNAKNIENADFIVYTGAVHFDNAELKYAKDNGIPIYRRTEILNTFFENHNHIISISGTHGKTTTSCMLTAILEEAGKEPDFFIGANVPQYNSCHRFENSDYLVVESCEYQASFLDFEPKTIIVNNIDYDHVDYYRDIDHVYNTFLQFIENLDDSGLLILNADDKYAARILDDVKGAYSFGIENEADFMAKNIEFDTNKLSYDFYYRKEKLTKIEMSILGIQNVYNSLGAYAAAYLNGIDISRYSSALFKYSNASRRFETLARKGESILISDYAHHPAEIKATIKTAKSASQGELIVIFQPHTFSRTKMLLGDLIESFDLADKVYLVDIDAVREIDNGDISSRDIVDGLVKKGKDAYYLGSLDKLENCIRENMGDNNMIIAMGAGKIDSYARKIEL